MSSTAITKPTVKISATSALKLILKYPRLDLIEKVSVYSVLGSEIVTFFNKNTKDISNLKAGVYIVKATFFNGKKLAKKIMFTK